MSEHAERSLIRQAQDAALALGPARADAIVGPGGLSGASEAQLRRLVEAAGPTIATGTTGLGLRWAALGGWRVVAYAEGGHCVHRHVQGVGWCLTTPDHQPPRDVREALCGALGIAC